jgi:hypothetical protein
MMKTLGRLVVAVCICMSARAAHALTIDSPLTLNSDGVLGTVRPGVPFSEPEVDDYVNFLLDMSLNSTTTSDGQTYVRNTALDPGTGSVSSTDYLTGTGTFVEAGWEYLAAKYDGPNGGLVVIYLGGESATLPTTSWNLWVNKQGKGYGLSGWIAYNTVCLVNCTLPDEPEPSVPDSGSTAMLLGSVLFALAVSRVFHTIC